MYVYTYTYIYIYIYVCMYVYIYIYIYIYLCPTRDPDILTSAFLRERSGSLHVPSRSLRRDHVRRHLLPVSVKTHSFWMSPCLAIPQRKLLSSP